MKNNTPAFSDFEENTQFFSGKKKDPLSEQEDRTAKILKEQELRTQRILKEQEARTKRILKEQQDRTARIQREQAKRTARIQSEQAAHTARLQKEQQERLKQAQADQKRRAEETARRQKERSNNRSNRSSGSNPYEPNYEDIFSGIYGESMRDLYEKLGLNFDDLFESMYGQQQSRGDQRPRREAPKPEPESPRNLDQELIDMLQIAAGADRQFGWLARSNLEDVKRVIRTVQGKRKEASEKGEEFTDRQAYLFYRRLVDKPAGEAVEAHQRSYQILEALMGGTIIGKLPF